MTERPRGADTPILGKSEWRTILFTAALQTAATLGVFIWALAHRDLVEARNLAFSVIVFTELFRSLASRSSRRVFWEVGAFSNVILLGVVLVSVLVQLGIHHIPATQALFQIGSLSLSDCALTILVGLGPVTIIELVKLARRGTYVLAGNQ